MTANAKSIWKQVLTWSGVIIFIIGTAFSTGKSSNKAEETAKRVDKIEVSNDSHAKDDLRSQQSTNVVLLNIQIQQAETKQALTDLKEMLKQKTEEVKQEIRKK